MARRARARVRIIDRDRGWKRAIRAMRKMAKGISVEAGIFEEDAQRDDSKSNVQIAVWNEMGIPENNQPPRPFLRPALDQNRSRIKAARDRAIRNAVLRGSDLEDEFEEVGELTADLIRDKIDEVTKPPLAPLTVQKKKHDKPLIDSEQMKNAVSHRVRSGKPRREGQE